MNSEKEENAHSKYVKKKVGSASLKKAEKLLESFKEEEQKDWNWALFAIIIFAVLVLSILIAEMI